MSLATASPELAVDAEATLERARVGLGELPPRYAEDWADPFLAGVRPALRPGVRILDVGAGRRPTIAPSERPAGCHYVGMDPSPSEIEAAPRGSYDSTVVAGAESRVAELERSVDLIVSWQVLEHVPSVAVALTNLRAYLRPEGRMVSLLSGRYGLFAVGARFMPHRARVAAMRHLLGVPPESKFPTRYDQCYYSALERLLSGWSSVAIIPRYKGAGYLRFSRSLERAYLAYENWIERAGHRNLATHYVITATR